MPPQGIVVENHRALRDFHQDRAVPVTLTEIINRQGIHFFKQFINITIICIFSAPVRTGLISINLHNVSSLFPTFL